MIGMIAAVNPDGVIGVGNAIPWRHPGDMKRFARVTRGGTVIMGRLTWESMGKKPLPKRRNIVITREALGDAVEHYPDVATALARVTEGDVWLIGGARIYAEGMKHADVIDLTYVPDQVAGADVVRFPPIDERVFAPGPLVEHEDEPGLTRRVFTRRS
jgi:dihydrofolate reductase